MTGWLAANYLRGARQFSSDEKVDFANGKPTIAYAKVISADKVQVCRRFLLALDLMCISNCSSLKRLPKHWHSFTNEQVLHFAELGVPEACRECIVRDVMAVDGLEYDEAMKIFDEIAMTNRRGIGMAAAPFYTGFSVAVVAGYGSIPAVFDLGSVEWINDTFVTTELPPMEDLETYLEVGSASWGWMEPVLGQISFFLLCMQFARSQMQNLGMRPYYKAQGAAFDVNEHWIALLCNVPLLEAARRAADISTGAPPWDQSANLLCDQRFLFLQSNLLPAAVAEPALAKSDKSAKGRLLSRAVPAKGPSSRSRRRRISVSSAVLRLRPVVPELPSKKQDNRIWNLKAESSSAS
ncbi:hypothetical protein THAOC_05535, partial [Thalassiosira oceanica]